MFCWFHMGSDSINKTSNVYLRYLEQFTLRERGSHILIKHIQYGRWRSSSRLGPRMASGLANALGFVRKRPEFKIFLDVVLFPLTNSTNATLRLWYSVEKRTYLALASDTSVAAGYRTECSQFARFVLMAAVRDILECGQPVICTTYNGGLPLKQCPAPQLRRLVQGVRPLLQCDGLVPVVPAQGTTKR